MNVLRSMDSGHSVLLGKFMPMRCANLKSLLPTDAHRGLTLCMCFPQGLNRKQMTHLKEDDFRRFMCSEVTHKGVGVATAGMEQELEFQPQPVVFPLKI